MERVSTPDSSQLPFLQARAWPSDAWKSAKAAVIGGELKCPLPMVKLCLCGDESQR